MNIIYSSGIALINGGKIFLIKPYMSNADKWGIPKGHAEINEDIEKTAAREFNEETGIKISGTLSYLSTVTTKFKDNIKHVKVYKCIGTGFESFIKSNIILEGFGKGNPENVDGRYFSYNEALTKIHRYQIPIIEKLKAEDMSFKLFYDNREPALAINESIYNKTISILLYDAGRPSKDDLVLLKKYSIISDEIVAFIDENDQEYFNSILDEYFINNKPQNLTIILTTRDTYFDDICKYIDNQLKYVNIIIGSNKELKTYKKYYEFGEYLKSKKNVKILDIKKHSIKDDK